MKIGKVVPYFLIVFSRRVLMKKKARIPGPADKDRGDPRTLRAVTLQGGTGRVHTWRYDPESSGWK
jgi:hypothetical protein